MAGEGLSGVDYQTGALGNLAVIRDETTKAIAKVGEAKEIGERVCTREVFVKEQLELEGRLGAGVEHELKLATEAVNQAGSQGPEIAAIQQQIAAATQRLLELSETRRLTEGYTNEKISFMVEHAKAADETALGALATNEAALAFSAVLIQGSQLHE